MEVNENQDDRDVSLLALDQYMRQVRQTEPLTQEEEALLVQRVERGKQERLAPCPNQWILSLARHARDRLVEAYQPLVIAIAKRCLWRFESMELLDLVQEGNLGLLQAIEANDLSKGLPLRLLAGRCIGQAMWQAMTRHDRLVHASYTLVGASVRMQQVRWRLEAQLSREPTDVEVAAAMGIAPEQVYRLLEVQARTHQSCVSLQGLLEEGEADEWIGFAALYQAQVAQDQARQDELEQAVQRALDTVLTPRQREVVQVRYGLGETCEMLSWQGIAERYGMSSTGARHHDQLARKKLARALAPMCRAAQDEPCA
jgi:RNA polymerase primary sigma factor